MEEILEFKKNYNDFIDFYDDTKEKIYFKIYDLYKQIDDNTIILIVRANIDNIIFDTKFEINKSKSKILIDLIKPYFESIEKYEICGDIDKLHEKIMKKNVKKFVY